MAFVEDSNFQTALSESAWHINNLLDITKTDDINAELLSKIEEVYLPTGKPMDEIGNKLDNIDNAAYLYSKALHCWLTENPRPSKISNRKNADCALRLAEWNLFFIPDDAMFLPKGTDASGSILNDLKTRAEKCAGNAITLLEQNENDSLITRSRNAECVYMLIKSKWLIYTHNFPLEEKQRILPDNEQWKEIAGLCDRYLDNIRAKNPDMPPHQTVLFLRATYNWLTGSNPKEVYDQFRTTERSIGTSWFLDRILLCKNKTNEPRLFYVSVKSNKNGSKFFARIEEELDPCEHDQKLVGREGIAVLGSEYIYLFGSNKPANFSKITKPVVIWINGAGPKIGKPFDVREAL